MAAGRSGTCRTRCDSSFRSAQSATGEPEGLAVILPGTHSRWHYFKDALSASSASLSGGRSSLTAFQIIEASTRW